MATDGTLTTGVNVTWSAVPNADIYLIYRNTVNSSATATQIGTDTASPFTDVTGTPGVIYFYFVRAMNSCATSAFSLSNSGYRALSAPTGVNASDTLLTSFVTVTWNSVAGASHYRVYRNQLNNPATATALGTWQTGTTYHDASAAPFITYFYWVRASTSSTGLLPSAFGGPNTGRH